MAWTTIVVQVIRRMIRATCPREVTDEITPKEVYDIVMAGIYDSQVLSGTRPGAEPSYTGIALGTLMRSRILNVESNVGGMRKWVEQFYRVWMGMNGILGTVPELRADGGRLGRPGHKPPSISPPPSEPRVKPTSNDADEIEVEMRWTIYNVMIEPETLSLGYEELEMLWETKLFEVVQRAGEHLIDRVMTRMEAGTGGYPDSMDVADMVEEVTKQGFGSETGGTTPLNKIEFSNYVVRIWLAKFVRTMILEDMKFPREWANTMAWWIAQNLMLVKHETDIVEMIGNDCTLFEEIISSMRRIESMGQGYPADYYRWIEEIKEDALKEALKGRRSATGIRPEPLDSVAEAEEHGVNAREAKDATMQIDAGGEMNEPESPEMDSKMEGVEAHEAREPDSENERGQGFSELFGHGVDTIADREEDSHVTRQNPEIYRRVVEDVWNQKHNFPFPWLDEARAERDELVKRMTDEVHERVTRENPIEESNTRGSGIHSFSEPVEWLRRICWGYHCHACFAWWLGYTGVDSNGEAFPCEGAVCPVCEKELGQVGKYSTLVKGRPPSVVLAAIVQNSYLPEYDPRRIVARLTERLAAEGMPWEEIDLFEPHELMVAAGIVVVDKPEAKLDFMDVIMTLGKIATDESGVLPEWNLDRCLERPQAPELMEDSVEPDARRRLRMAAASLRESPQWREEIQAIARDYRVEGMGFWRANPDVRREQWRRATEIAIERRASSMGPMELDRELRAQRVREVTQRLGPEVSDRLLIRGVNFSIFNLEDLMYKVLKDVTIEDLMAGLNSAGAGTVAAEIKKRIEQHRGRRPEFANIMKVKLGEVVRKQYQEQLEVKYRPEDIQRWKPDRRREEIKKLPLWARCTMQRILLGGIRDKGANPSRIERRLYAYLQLIDFTLAEECNEPEDEEAGGVKKRSRNWQEVIKPEEMKEKIMIPHYKMNYRIARRRSTWEAVVEAAEAGQSWMIHSAEGAVIRNTSWVTWTRDEGEGIGATVFNPIDYLTQTKKAAIRAMVEKDMAEGDYHPNLYTEEVARGRTQYFPAHELVNALMVDSLRVTLTDRASKLCASAIFKNWVPQFERRDRLMAELHAVQVLLDGVVRSANQMPMVHPHMMYGLATLTKLRDFYAAMREAAEFYGLGSRPLGTIVADASMKEPMHPLERPEMMATNVRDVMRSMASALILTEMPETWEGLTLAEYRDRQERAAVEMDEQDRRMGWDRMRERAMTGHERKYNTAVIRQDPDDSKAVMLNMSLVAANPITAHRAPTANIRSDRVEHGRDVPGELRADRFLTGDIEAEPTHRPFMIQADRMRASMESVVTKIIDGTLISTQKGKENMTDRERLQEAEDRIKQLKFRLTNVAVRLVMVGLIDEDEDDPLCEEFDEDYERRKYYSDEEWKNIKEAEVQLGERDILVMRRRDLRGMPREEVIARLIAKLADKVSEVEKCKWVIGRMAEERMDKAGIAAEVRARAVEDKTKIEDLSRQLEDMKVEPRGGGRTKDEYKGIESMHAENENHKLKEELAVAVHERDRLARRVGELEGVAENNAKLVAEVEVHLRERKEELRRIGAINEMRDEFRALRDRMEKTATSGSGATSSEGTSEEGKIAGDRRVKELESELEELKKEYKATKQAGQEQGQEFSELKKTLQETAKLRDDEEKERETMRKQAEENIKKYQDKESELRDSLQKIEEREAALKDARDKLERAEERLRGYQTMDDELKESRRRAQESEAAMKKAMDRIRQLEDQLPKTEKERDTEDKGAEKDSQKGATTPDVKTNPDPIKDSREPDKMDDEHAAADDSMNIVDPKTSAGTTNYESAVPESARNFGGPIEQYSLGGRAAMVELDNPVKGARIYKVKENFEVGRDTSSTEERGYGMAASKSLKGIMDSAGIKREQVEKIKGDEEAEWRFQEDLIRRAKADKRDIEDKPGMSRMSRRFREIQRRNAAVMGEINKKVMLQTSHTVKGHPAHGRWELTLIPTGNRDADGNEMMRNSDEEVVLLPIVEQTTGVENLEKYKMVLERIVSQLADETRMVMGIEKGKPEELVTATGVSNDSVTTWTGATLNELGIKGEVTEIEKPYPANVYIEMARIVAELAAWGGDAYPVQRGDRRNVRRSTQEAMIDGSAINKGNGIEYALWAEQHHGGGIAWSRIRKEVDERSSYRLRRGDEYRIAYLSQFYGIEIASKVYRCPKTKELKVGIPLAVRPTSGMRMPRNVAMLKSWAGDRVEGQKEERESLWFRLHPADLPCTGYMVVGDAQWQEYAKDGIVWPEAGHSGVIVEGWHRDDMGNPLRGSQMTLKAHWTKYSVEPSDVSSMHGLEFPQGGMPEWLYDSLRLAAVRGRRIGIAIDMRMFTLIGGDVVVTRSGRFMLLGPVPMACWKAVWFEDTYTALYMRDCELDMLADERGVSQVNRDRLSKTLGTDEYRDRVRWIMSEMTEECVHCLACHCRMAKGIVICPMCCKPMPSYPDYLMGMNLWEITDRNATMGRKAKWKTKLQEALDRAGIKISFRMVAERIDMIERDVVAGILASLNPAEDWYLGFRAGLWPEYEIAASRPGVYRFAMEEAAIHAMMLDRELATSFGKILNFEYNQSGTDHSGIVDASDFQQALETVAARAVVTARQRFFSMHAGCLRRGGQFMSYQLLIAMAAGFNSPLWGNNAWAKSTRDMMVQTANSCLEIMERIVAETKRDPTQPMAKHTKFDTEGIPFNATWGEIKGKKNKLHGYSHAAGSAIRNLGLRRERSETGPVTEVYWCSVPMGGMMMNWASMGVAGHSRDEAQPEARAANAGTAYPIAGVSLVELNEKGWPRRIESKGTRTVDVELKDETGKRQEPLIRAESSSPIQPKERGGARTDGAEPKARTRSPLDRERRDIIRWPKYAMSDDSSVRSSSRGWGKGRDRDRADDRGGRYGWMPTVPRFAEGTKMLDRGRGKGSLLERTRAQRGGHVTGPETEDESAMSEALNPEFRGTETTSTNRANVGVETGDDASDASAGDPAKGKGKHGRPLMWRPRRDRQRDEA